MTDFSKQMTAVERDRSYPNVRPKDASTLIIPADVWTKTTGGCRSLPVSIPSPKNT
jgi:hypothetical protein